MTLAGIRRKLVRGGRGGGKKQVLGEARTTVCRWGLQKNSLIIFWCCILACRFCFVSFYWSSRTNVFIFWLVLCTFPAVFALQVAPSSTIVGVSKEKITACVVTVKPTPRARQTTPRGQADDSDDDDSFSDDSEPEAKQPPPKLQASTPRRGKKRAAATAAAGPWSETPGSARRNGAVGNGRGDGGGGGSGGGESNPWESMAGLSLCQFWRYRLLLEVVLAARGGGQPAGGREEHGGVVPEPRLAEVSEE